MDKQLIRLASLIFLIAFFFLGCQALPPLRPRPSTSMPSAASPRQSPTPCQTGLTWAYGSVPPEFVPKVEKAMTASGLQGSVEASTFGENDGCGQYHVRNVDYRFTVNVPDLAANDELASKAGSVLEIAQRFVPESTAPSLGKLQLTFASAQGLCNWAYESGAWTFQSSSLGSADDCQVPVSRETEQMAQILNEVALDLVCETSSVRADVLRAELECERPEGAVADRYLVTIKISTGTLDYAETCFHGWRASEYNLTGQDPMTVTEGTNTYYERDRSFQWVSNGKLFYLLERIKGGPDVTLPEGTRETLYQRALQAGLIAGEGSDCP